jgi:hypothetical protein
LHPGVYRQRTAFDKAHGAAHKVPPAALLRKAIDLVEKSRGQRIGHQNSLA